MTTDMLDHVTSEPDRLPPPDPLTPFAVPGGPSPDRPITDAHVTEAYERFCRFYGDADHAAIPRGAQKALAAAKQRDRWTVLPGGALELQGSGDDTYLVSDEDCRKKGRSAKKGGPVYCPSFLYGQGKHGGQCYHTITRELIRIAQILAHHEAELRAHAEEANTVSPRLLPTDDLDSDLAFVTLSGDELAAACFLACGASATVRLSASGGDLHIRAGRRSVTLDGQDGMGACALTVAAEDFAALWDALRPLASQLPSVQVFVDRELQTLSLCAAGEEPFSASTPGTRTWLRYIHMIAQIA
jgi:hypothetical protein